MERTDSKSLQVHPMDEQYFIEVMQRFHWNLQSTQTVHIKDSHTEARGDNLYSITETEKYVKLMFTRPASFQNKDKLVALESEFFNMNYSEKRGYKGSITVIIIGFIVILLGSCGRGSLFATPSFWVGLIVAGAGVLWYMNTKKTNESISLIASQNNSRRNEILAEVDKLDTF